MKNSLVNVYRKYSEIWAAGNSELYYLKLLLTYQ